MKLAKRLTALALVALLLVSVCSVIASAATASVTLTYQTGHNVTNDGAVKYSKYNIYGSQSGHTEASTVLTFNPNNGYIPMAFVKNAGSGSVMANQYSEAVNKYGYEVAGVINGSFFDMNTTTLCGNLIVDGKVSCAHVDYNDSFVVFGSDGSMNIVQSQLAFTLRIKGVEVPNGLSYLNKKYSACGDWGNDRFFYYDTSCGSTADTSVAGTEIICEKVNNSELAVGQTLFGKVTEIRKSSYGAKFGTAGELSDKFVLFVKDGSSYASYANGLVVGDTVSITTTETIEASREIMEKANSAITNVGWLVKDGVDQTNIYSSIGSHSVTGTYARWTAFGQKADGTYVFFTSEGGSTGATSRSLTLKDVAAAMIKLGCKNVIRMDGGGSSAMYVSNTGSGSPGYVQSSSRGAADCILVVKKSSLVDSALNAKLASAIQVAKSSNPDAETQALIAEAEAILNSSTPVSGDVKRALMNVSPMSSLQRVLANAEAINIFDFSAQALQELRAAYNVGSDYYYGGKAATNEQLASCVTEINKCLNKSVGGKSISYGCSYTASAQSRDNYLDNGVLLTDGIKGSADGGAEGVYAGWNGTNEVIIDLGSAKEFNHYSVYLAAGNWGIMAPTSSSMKVEVYASNSKTTGYTALASTTDVKRVLGTGAENSWSTYLMEVDSANTTARYVKIVITNNLSSNNYIWADEVEVTYVEKNASAAQTVTNGIIIKKFNTSILSGDCTIFTPDFGTITVAKANHAWTTNVVVKWNSVVGAYIVKSVTEGNGSSTPAITLASDELLICGHGWDTVAGSMNNKLILGSATVGQKMLNYGVDIENRDAGVATYIKFIAADGTDPDFACSHNYIANVTKPTCTEGGYTTYTCDKCGDSYTDNETGKLGHSYTSVVTKPTCTEGGYTTYTCSTCGDSYTGNETGKLGHSYTSEVTKPTCTEGGYTTYTCSTCGDSYTGNEIGKLGHSYNSVVTKPTCTEGGYTTYTCGTCGDSYIGNETDKLGHSYTSVVTKPTCTEDGYTTHTCANCGDSYVDSYVDACHAETDDWVEYEDGSKELFCPECGESIDFREALPEYNYDINGDDRLDMFDYILVKSIYVTGEYNSEEEYLRADVNKDGRIDMFDYIAVKAAYMF